MHHKTSNSPGTMVAAGALLDRWLSHDWGDGMHIGDLLPLDRLTVRTLNSTYEIVVVTPGSADVAVRGGVFFPTFARVRVAGCSLGGGFLKRHWIHIGFRMELVFNTQSIVTSPVQTISMVRSDAVVN